ncbi:DUF6318 family protein [Kribbella sp. NPDC051587]|uniref:DUF6318 family protein n=1 Tax=Kribbella sp. NPDC051587 TaxID=3364119 RepID=UPI0037A17E6D
MTIRNKPAFLAAACLSALLLSACGPGSPEAGRPNTSPPPPATAPTTGSGSSSTPTTTPSGAPQRPAAANGLTLGAADAFYRYYIELENYAAATGDTSALLDESDAGCEGCKEYADFVAKVNAANGGISGDFRFKIKDVSQLARGSTGRVGGKAQLSVGRFTTKDTPTSKPIISEPTNYVDTIALSASGTNWVMYEMDSAEQ